MTALRADFDRDGNLLLGYGLQDRFFLNRTYNLARITKEQLQAGGVVTPEVLLSRPTEAFRQFVQDLKVSCGGSAYLALTEFAVTLSSSVILKIDLTTDAVVQEIRFPRTAVESIALSCHTDELYGSRLIWRNEFDPDTEFWKWTEALGSAEPPTIDKFLRDPGGTLTVGPAGTLFTENDIIVSLLPRVTPCSICAAAMTAATPGAPACQSPTPQPFCAQPEAGIGILPGTTRWKPQRDTSKNIDVIFTGPKDILDPNAVTNVTLEIKDPTGASVANPTLSPMTVLDASSDPVKAQITWSGPWITTNPQGSAAYRPRGDHKVKIVATRKDGSRIESSESDPNSTVSLVEVTKVELCQADATDDCAALTTPYPDVSADNPAVNKISSEDPAQSRPAEGKRIFAEAPSRDGTVLNRVKVRATIEPKIPADASRPTAAVTVPVYFKSFDVDDPAGCVAGSKDPNPCLPDIDKDQGDVADNRGKPAEGNVITPSFDVAAGKTFARTFFETSSQAGDNYRVIATTSTDWRDIVKAVQPSTTGELSITPEEKKTNVSDMLTVWRTIHLELDAMAPPPQSDHPERNFIAGKVTKITADGPLVTKLFVEDTGASVIGLADRSPDLDASSLVEGKGRFEKGTIRLGTGDAAVVISNLEGNGIDYVRKPSGMEIPVEIRDAQGNNPLAGKVIGWDVTLHVFTVSMNVPSDVYANGKLRIGGVDWAMSSVNGAQLMVEDKDLPFFLVDDDSAVPLPLDTTLLQASDDSRANPFAHAYIRPAFDLENPRPEAPFKRNISTPRKPDGTEDRSVFFGQAAIARDNRPLSSNAYWVGYGQAADQPDETVDMDPGSEMGPDSALGWTSGDITYVFAETIAEQLEQFRQFGDDAYQLVKKRCLAKVPAHEFGHQLGLDDPKRPWERSGLMTPGCSRNEPFFMLDELDVMRSKGAAR